MTNRLSVLMYWRHVSSYKTIKKSSNAESCLIGFFLLPSKGGRSDLDDIHNNLQEAETQVTELQKVCASV